MDTVLNDTNRSKFNPKNERVIKKYQEHLRCAFGSDNKTLYLAHRSIRFFEILTDFKDLESFNKDIANRFHRELSAIPKITKKYLHRITMDIKKFLRWLASEKEGRRIKPNDVDYLNLTRNEIRTARSSSYKRSYKYGVWIDILNKMPNKTIIDMRNRALVSTQILGSFRATELSNFRIDTFIYDEDNGVYFADINPEKIEGVKFCKDREATLFKESEILDNIFKWRDYLIQEWKFKDADPLFPSIPNTFNKNIVLFYFGFCPLVVVLYSCCCIIR